MLHEIVRFVHSYDPAVDGDASAEFLAEEYVSAYAVFSVVGEVNSVLWATIRPTRELAMQAGEECCGLVFPSCLENGFAVWPVTVLLQKAAGTLP